MVQLKHLFFCVFEVSERMFLIENLLYFNYRPLMLKINTLNFVFMKGIYSKLVV